MLIQLPLVGHRLQVKRACWCLARAVSDERWSTDDGGAAGIVGVVVLIKDGSDQATNVAAPAVLNVVRSSGLNAARGDWPGDWCAFRGTRNGRQTP